MKTNHTPGPWEVRPSSNPASGSKWRDIVSVGTEFKPSYVAEAIESDARLIAAAPELLAALQELIQYSEHHVGEVCTDSGLGSYVAARAAIAKAIGEGQP